jgi:hypothetical protein
MMIVTCADCVCCFSIVVAPVLNHTQPFALCKAVGAIFRSWPNERVLAGVPAQNATFNRVYMGNSWRFLELGSSGCRICLTDHD